MSCLISNLEYKIKNKNGPLRQQNDPHAGARTQRKGSVARHWPGAVHPLTVPTSFFLLCKCFSGDACLWPGAAAASGAYFLLWGGEAWSV